VVIGLNKKSKRESTANNQWGGWLNLFPPNDKDILRIYEIKQNEFLNVNPRIIEDPRAKSEERARSVRKVGTRQQTCPP